MEAKLESVLASISNPGLIAGSGGLVTDGNARMPYSTLDSGPGGAEGRGDVHVGVDPSIVASALESIRSGRSSATPGALAGPSGTQNGASRPSLNSHRSDSNPESAITRREPIVLPSLAHSDTARFEGGGTIGAHAEIGPSRSGGHPVHTTMPPVHTSVGISSSPVTSMSMPTQLPIPPPHHQPPTLHQQHPHLAHPAHPMHPHVHFAGNGGSSGSGSSHGLPGGTRVTSAPASSAGKSSPLEWSGIKDPNAVDGSPRLHSLPDNTLNP